MQLNYENEKQYNKRIKAECDAERAREMASPWFKRILDFFQRKATEAKEVGDKNLSEFWVRNGEEFFNGHLTYVALGYREAVKDPKQFLLTTEESRRRIKNAKSRIKKYENIRENLERESQSHLNI